MLARNPNTGGTIRIMKSDASIWKNRKTIVYKKDGPKSKTDLELWKRWDIIVATTDPHVLQWSPQIIVLTEDSPSVHAWLQSAAPKSVQFILITLKIVNSFGSDAFHALNLGNVICLEEFTSMYPFLGAEWDGTVEDAIINAAIVFRYTRLIGVKNNGERLKNLKLRVSLTIDESSQATEPLVLIQQYYVPAQSKRAKELYKCLVKNLECKYVDKIILCMETPNAKLPPDPNGKIIKIPMKTRLTYKACIEVIQSKVEPGHIVVFANTDIYLDSSWRSVWSVNLEDTLLALLRWEEGDYGSEPTIFGPRSDSQDSWVIHSDSVLSRSWDLDAFNIPFGKSGCDNAVLIPFLKHKFKISNPAMNLRTIHVHQSEIRTYVKSDLVDKPIYMYVDPTGIHELNPVLTWDKWASKKVVDASLDRPLKATNPKMLGIFCSQLNRDPAFVWSANSLNTYVSPQYQDRYIDISGGFVSPNGLVYTHNELCVGSTEIQKKLWSENTLSHIMPSQDTNIMMAFPLESVWLNDSALYTLYYLSKVVKQHCDTPTGSFWCKKTEELLHAFKLFRWANVRGHILEYSEESQAFAEKIVGRTSHTVRLMPPDIDALRTALYNPWKSESQNPILVIVTDTLHIKDSIESGLEALGLENGYTIKTLSSNDLPNKWDEVLSGASRVILSTSAKNLKTNTWAWAWMAPKGCKFLELQEEREPSDNLLHLCAAAGQEWTLLQYPRSTPDGFKKIIINEATKWFNSESASKNTLPLVIVPAKTMKFGFFGHKGDSFREMVDMWAEKGLVECKEDPAVTQCWLSSVGHTLLYDRPTWSWLEKSSEAEQKYKVCLTGNPEPSKPNAKPWIFWPRQPRLVEKLASTLKPLEDRKDSIVFFGRVENDIQGKYRQDISGWQSICSQFSMPIGAKEPYTLSPEEYLLALQNARYGLCLRGFGAKCNREIELLAMGTVPLVTPGVDITNYAEPLIDGIHILCVSDPMNAKQKISAITHAQWETMSKAGHMWWMRNASVDGSWLRTKEYI